MSYLNALRLHFAGRFQANVSTVNNDPGHFDNAAFQPSYQDEQGALPNGWFNPQGDASFRLLGCAITSAWTKTGGVTNDPVLKCSVADGDTRVPGKLVDLDSEQQLVSEIWGLQVRIADATGKTLVSGHFEPAPFIDLWARAPLGGGDANGSAAYQSVLVDVHWGDVSASPFLTALQAASAKDMLSIKFNVDGLNMDFKSPNFMCGRIAGTIGPYLANEPHSLVLGRQFMAQAAQYPANFFLPAGSINFFPAVIDPAAGTIYLDLGNALPTDTPGGAMTDLGDLSLDVMQPSGNTTIGVIPAKGSGGYVSDAHWYANTAGVVQLPIAAYLLQAAQGNPLALLGNQPVGITEWSNGAFVRADTFVYRLNPGDHAQVDIYATQWGAPLAGASISFTLDPSQLQPSNNVGAWTPPVGTPTSALTFAPTATTDTGGKATITVTAQDPGTPRWFNNGQDYGIDGQVYGIRPAFADASMTAGPINELDFVSFLVWSGFAIPAEPTWTDVQPIFQQYANLYPVMLRFLDLADYASVKANAELLQLAFGLPVTDPNSMPVTRDLSQAKRQTILKWLANPVRATAAPPRLVAERAPEKPAGAAAAAAAGAGAAMAGKGGKSAARANRLALHQGGERR
jgi:hypothetical protein